MRARAIFVGGTASHVGKSWMTTSICRHLRERGFRVAPFKAQNMSNNSFPLKGGGEIGRAQVAQAAACGLEPEAAFNPILLKPDSDRRSQFVVNGRVWRTLPARDYYEHFDWLWEQVTAAYESLARRFDYIVIEGAGSIAELNLARTDLVNLRMAAAADARALLVGDIDRGGIFASIIGTYCLLDPADRARVRSFAVNRFRGDPALFTSGVEILQNKTGAPCLGVFPYLAGDWLDEEDGVSVDPSRSGSDSVAVIALPRISNTTDFRLLPHAAWIRTPVDRAFSHIIIPGTKNTHADLEWLRAQGLDAWLKSQLEQGARILGVCGGYQMLGERVDDLEGLGLLPVETVTHEDKITLAVDATLPDGHAFPAYEIHMGVTTVKQPAPPFAFIQGQPEGAVCGRVAGTYLHGALEDPGVLSRWLDRPVDQPLPREQRYQRLGEWFAANANLELFEDLYLC
jgi:adenosylcobyric acid synthase